MNIIYKQRLVLLAAILVLTGSLVWFFKSKKTKIPEGQMYQKMGMNQAFLKNPLSEAEEVLLENDTTKFYYTINNCLRKYLSVKLKYPENELSKKINELLDRCNVRISTTLMLTSLLENIELKLYAQGSSANHMQEVYEKASEVVSLLDKQVC